MGRICWAFWLALGGNCRGFCSGRQPRGEEKYPRRLTARVSEGDREVNERSQPGVVLLVVKIRRKSLPGFQ